MKISEFIKKIQNLPEPERKIILWVLVVILGIVLLFFYAGNVQKKIKSFDKNKTGEDFGIPELKEELNNLPKFEMPDINLTDEEKKELENFGEWGEEATGSEEATSTP